MTLTASLRLALLWILMLAMPFKAIAAVSMPFCGVGEHHRDAVQASAPAHTHGSEAGRAHEHGRPQATSAQPDSPSAGHDGHLAGNASCSLCSACCHASMTTTTLHDSPILPDAPLAVVAFVSFAGFIGEAPERPPRALA